jgi:glycerol-3-phosphate dehydrogenase (NAD(P)+)
VKIGILGLGSWGTALAALLARNGHQVHGWTHDPEQRRLLRAERENRKYLPGVHLPGGVTIEETIGSVVIGAAAVVFAVPSHALREVALMAAPDLPREALVINVAKGLEETSLARMSEILCQVLPDRGGDGSGVVSLLGPSHAEEVSRDHPTALVAASLDPEAARGTQAIFNCETLRVYTSPDLVGVELAAGLKNVIAIAAGISFGVGYGDNSFGALVTRGLAEMTRLGVAMGGRPETFAGLSGLGDLVTTCVSRHSRNRFVGEEIGKGRKPGEVISGMSMVAEGVRTTRAVRGLVARAGIEMPIADQVHEVLFSGKDPRAAIRDLMLRDPKAELS